MVWLWLLIMITAAWGWSRWFAEKSAIDSPLLLTSCLTLALSSGALSLIMLWLGLLRIPIHPYVYIPLYAAVMIPGWWLARRILWPEIAMPPRMTLFVIMILIGISAAILFNAIQWPFYRDDALGIYAPFAAEIAVTHALAPINTQRMLYELYPQLISMNYANLYMLAGWENPYVCRVFAALLGLGCLSVTYLIGRQIAGHVAGLSAVLLLALIPDFGNWASTGYVDLPMAFFYALAGLFLIALYDQENPFDALLCAVMIGLAAWTKNAALLGIIIISTFLLIGLIIRKLRVNNLLIAYITIALIISPWYIRNLVLASTFTPDTVWVEDSRQTLREVFILVTLPQNYGLPGAIILVGIMWSLWQAIWLPNKRMCLLILLGLIAPYYLTWFLYASYDPRFMLLILPPFAVIGGIMIANMGDLIRHRRKPIVAIMMIAISVLALGVMWDSVEFKRALLNNPHMTHEMKVDVVTNRN